MKTITDIMTHEHELIKTVIDVMVKNADLLDDGAQFRDTFYMDVISFIKEYSNKIHHIKEEDILFPVALEHENTKDNPDVKILVHQHILSRALVEVLEEALEKDDKVKLIKASREYAELIGGHIDRENNLLLPILEEKLPEKVKNEIVKRFNEVDASFTQAQIRHYEELAIELQKKIISIKQH